MKAMILAAGRGERMRPLTDTTPKPLLLVHGKPLIVWHVEKLASAGFGEIVINIAHLGYMIPKALGDGSKWGVKLIYSDEQTCGALESAGGIVKALEFLDDTFLVVNGDIWCDYDFIYDFNLKNRVAHLILVPNPTHNQNGDFGLKNDLLQNGSDEKFTFSGIGYYSKEFFKGLECRKMALAPLFREAVEKNEISGELYKGIWHDIGTPQRLQNINSSFTMLNI